MRCDIYLPHFHPLAPIVHAEGGHKVLHGDVSHVNDVQPAVDLDVLILVVQL